MIEHLARVLAEQRRAEDTLGARRLLPPVLAQLTVIEHLATDTKEPVRRELLTVGAHYEQFAAWMYQDSMDPAGAQRHYAAAMAAAHEIGDADMVTPSRRHAGMPCTVTPRPPSARWTSPQRSPTPPPSTPTAHHLGRTSNDPDRPAFQRGVAYVELGRHTDAVPLLTTALGGLAEDYDRDRGRYAGMLALAPAGAGEADEALLHAKRAAELAVATGSALAAQEQRRVRAVLHAQRAVLELAEHLDALTG